MGSPDRVKTETQPRSEHAVDQLLVRHMRREYSNFPSNVLDVVELNSLLPAPMSKQISCVQK